MVTCECAVRVSNPGPADYQTVGLNGCGWFRTADKRRGGRAFWVGMHAGP
jgi:hypothetical protein